MGQIIQKMRQRRLGQGGGGTPAAGPKAPHTADWLYAKHKADQGFGTMPADPAAATSAPEGGQVVDEDEALRRRLGGN